MIFFEYDLSCLSAALFLVTISQIVGSAIYDKCNVDGIKNCYIFISILFSLLSLSTYGMESCSTVSDKKLSMAISSVLRVLLVIANLIFTSIVFHSDNSKCNKETVSTAKTFNIFIWIVIFLSFLIFDHMVIRSVKFDEVNEDNHVDQDNQINENVNNTNESEV